MTVRVVIVGGTAVGKTSLFHGLTGKPVTRPTLTCVCYASVVQNGSTPFMLWDTPGAERFRSVLVSPMRTAGLVVVVFDMASYCRADLDAWVEFAFTCASVSPGILVVIDKCAPNMPQLPCPYKLFMVNSVSGYNIPELLRYMKYVCSQLIPMQMDTVVLDAEKKTCFCW